MLKYTDITQNTCVQSWTFTEIMAWKKCGLLAVPNTATCTADALPVHCACPSLRVKCNQPATALWTVSYLYGVAKMRYLYGVAKMPFVFSHMEYCDMHFVYGFCDGNARAAIEEYQRRFPDRRIPSRGVYSPDNAWDWLSSKWWCAVWKGGGTHVHVPCKVLGTLRTTPALVRVFM
jgi:hypothetical protein